MNTSTPDQNMALALALAARGRFTVSPNPMVGSVIVKDGQMVGQGYHVQAGGPHAEIFALQEAGERARGAEVYVTLEPCCHQGRMPPCTDALIAAGVKKVYVACLDPHSRVAGKGVAALRSAGIEVELGLRQAEASQQNEIFFHYITHQRPFVIAKWAMSLDGKTSVAPHDSRQLSSPESQQHTHQLRQQVDAILVGAHTVCQDNPQLTARLTTEEGGVKQPTRVILSGRQPLPQHLKVFDKQLPGKTIIATLNKNDLHGFKSLLSEKLEVLVLPKDNKGHVDLSALLDELGKREITSLLVEGGMTVHESFFKAQLVNKVQVYLTPTFIGSLEKKQPLQFLQSFSLGSDFHFIANSQEVTRV